MVIERVIAATFGHARPNAFQGRTVTTGVKIEPPPHRVDDAAVNATRVRQGRSRRSGGAMRKVTRVPLSRP
jgi:hypothetical protein